MKIYFPLILLLEATEYDELASAEENLHHIFQSSFSNSGVTEKTFNKDKKIFGCYPANKNFPIKLGQQQIFVS